MTSSIFCIFVVCFLKWNSRPAIVLRRKRMGKLSLFKALIKSGRKLSVLCAANKAAVITAVALTVTAAGTTAGISYYHSIQPDSQISQTEDGIKDNTDKRQRLIHKMQVRRLQIRVLLVKNLGLCKVRNIIIPAMKIRMLIIRITKTRIMKIQTKAA